MPDSARLSRARRRRGGLLVGLTVCLVLVGVLGWLGYAFVFNKRDGVPAGELITETVISGPFDHIVLEQGEIESSRNTEVLCEVKSRSYSGVPILWVIDEGARVKAGEKLVELDSAAIEAELREAKLSVTAATANVTSAEALVEQAKIAREEYLEGVFKTEESAIQSEIAIAEQELRKAQLALESSERLLAKGLVKKLQLDADKFALINAKTKVESAEARLRVLQNLTKKKMLVQFDSDIEAAEAQLSAYQSNLAEEEQELADTETQLANCVIEAPVDGIVVHANRYSGRGGSAEFVVEPGAAVRERQAIVRLPDPTQMQIKCKINESRITLIKDGMPVKISVDAIPGMQLKGRVKKVNRYAEPSSFFSSSIKEYAVFIEILDPPDNIRTGMTAGVQVFVEQLADAKQIPIQGLYEHGGEMYTLVQRGPQSFETKQVEIGATNDTMATIEAGLEEGDEVVLNLREHLNLMDLPEVITTDNSDMRELRTEPSAAPAAGEPGAFEGRPDGPSGEGRPGAGGGRPDGAGRPGGGRPDGAGRPGGGRPDGAGRPGGGGPGAGGPPDVGTMVQSSMQRNDTDGDGSLSQEEISAVDERWRSALQAADADGDGKVSRAELRASIMKRMSGGGQQ
jgi:RND family efflux transporter MFP subunit